MTELVNHACKLYNYCKATCHRNNCFTVLISYSTYNCIHTAFHMSRWFVFINRIYTVILLEKKTSLTHPDPIVTANFVIDLTNTPIHQIIHAPQPLYTVYQMYNLLALCYQNLKGAPSPWFIYLYIIIREL